MPALVLGSAASQEPLELFFERLGDEAIDVIGPDGRIRARVIPAPDAGETTRSEAFALRMVEEFGKDIEELKRRALQPRSGITTEELLRTLNSLPLPS